MADLNALLTPGMFVEHPDRPEWGTGQIQSNIAGKITVNFPNAGKIVVEGRRVALLPVFNPPTGLPEG